MKIDELSGSDRSGGWYAEGHSQHPKVLLRDNHGKVYTWFCFEMNTWVEMAMELQKIGFTADQIVRARRVERARRLLDILRDAEGEWE